MIKTCDDGEERIRKVWRNHTWSVPLILPFHWLPNTTLPCRKNLLFLSCPPLPQQATTHSPIPPLSKHGLATTFMGSHYLLPHVQGSCVLGRCPLPSLKWWKISLPGHAMPPLFKTIRKTKSWRERVYMKKKRKREKGEERWDDWYVAYKSMWVVKAENISLDLESLKIYDKKWHMIWSLFV